MRVGAWTVANGTRGAGHRRRNASYRSRRVEGDRGSDRPCGHQLRRRRAARRLVRRDARLPGPLRLEEWRRQEVLFVSLRVTDTFHHRRLPQGERSGVNVDHLALWVDDVDVDELAASGRFEVAMGPADLFGAQGTGPPWPPTCATPTATPSSSRHVLSRAAAPEPPARAPGGIAPMSRPGRSLRRGDHVPRGCGQGGGPGPSLGRRRPPRPAGVGVHPLVAGDEATIGRHHPPPRQVVGAGGQQVADGPGGTRAARRLGHLAVGPHLAGPGAAEHLHHPLGEPRFAHSSSSAPSAATPPRCRRGDRWRAAGGGRRHRRRPRW